MTILLSIQDGKTALTVAFLGNHVPVVQKLLEASADPEQEIEASTNIILWKCLYRTEWASSYAIIHLQNGETLLVRAAKDNFSEMVENLLKYHADPNRQDMVTKITSLTQECVLVSVNQP